MVVHCKTKVGRSRKKAARRKRLLHAAALGAMGLSIQVGAVKASTFSFTGSVQDYTIPTAGTYEIVAFGAQGGFSGNLEPVAGGLGAKIGGFFDLAAGTQLQIFVGGQGGTGGAAFGGYAGGGGGGTFVYNATTSTLLLAAGGGGGGHYYGNVGGDGQTGLGLNPGAAGSGSSEGGGGAGFMANANVVGGTGGQGFPSFAGGVASYAGSAAGGFGGGGASGGFEAGGGGGYSGGDGGDPAGGGYSFNGGTLQTNVAGFRMGNGEVTLDLVPVPEPTTMSLVATGFAALAGLSAARSRRRSAHTPL